MSGFCAPMRFGGLLCLPSGKLCLRMDALVAYAVRKRQNYLPKHWLKACLKDKPINKNKKTKYLIPRSLQVGKLFFLAFYAAIGGVVALGQA